VNCPKVIYRPRADANHQAQLDVLAGVYRFILDCHERKKAVPADRPERPERIKDDPAKTILPEKL
jgi:hypothetical protein